MIDMISVARCFELWAGKQVKYVSHGVANHWFEVRYTIPSFDKDRVFSIHGHLLDGLGPTLHAAIRKAAARAQLDAYVRTGERDRDMARLQQGKLA